MPVHSFLKHELVITIEKSSKIFELLSSFKRKHRMPETKTPDITKSILK
jgi:hypothetical protein